MLCTCTLCITFIYKSSLLVKDIAGSRIISSGSGNSKYLGIIVNVSGIVTKSFDMTLLLIVKSSSDSSEQRSMISMSSLSLVSLSPSSLVLVSLSVVSISLNGSSSLVLLSIFYIIYIYFLVLLATNIPQFLKAFTTISTSFLPCFSNPFSEKHSAVSCRKVTMHARCSCMWAVARSSIIRLNGALNTTSIG